MQMPFTAEGLWPDPDEIEYGNGLEALDNEDGEPFAHDSSRAATGELAAIDALLARTGRILHALERQLPETAPLGHREPDYGGGARLDAWLGSLATAEDAPAVLATAIALDAWLMLKSAERGGEVGFSLATTGTRSELAARTHGAEALPGVRRDMKQ
jgi:hypothetical protein